MQCAVGDELAVDIPRDITAPSQGTTQPTPDKPQASAVSATAATSLLLPPPPSLPHAEASAAPREAAIGPKSSTIAPSAAGKQVRSSCLLSVRSKLIALSLSGDANLC